MLRFRLATLAVCGLIASASWADEPVDWLSKMGAALDEASYRGIIIREQDSRTDTFKIFRTLRDGVIRQRLVRQDGDGIEIIRNGNEVHCVLPEKRAVLVEDWNGQGTLFSAIPEDVDALTDAYEFAISGKDRVAGRKAVIVSITPKDGLRFAHRLWLDMQTGFPLKSERADEQGQLVDRIRFADIEIGVELSELELSSGHPLGNFKWYPAVQTGRSEATFDWHSDGLPAGYRKESGHVETLDASTTVVTHIVYTDGLSRVSVFIKPGDGNTSTTRAQLGNAHSYSMLKGEFRVTAVGEAPPAAVEQIALSMQR